MPMGDKEALTELRTAAAGAPMAGLGGERRPHLLSWVLGEPLNHVLQFPGRDRWGQSHAQDPGLGGRGRGLRGASPLELAG